MPANRIRETYRRIALSYPNLHESPGETPREAYRLDHDREWTILDWVRRNAEQRHQSQNERSGIVNITQFQILSTRGCVNSSVLRHSDSVIQTQSARQEERHSQAPRAFLERTIQDLHDSVQGRVAELVFNLAEVGIPDWEDRKTHKVIVSSATLSNRIHHGVSRNVKHISKISPCIVTS
jgi:hypothetical protein